MGPGIISETQQQKTVAELRAGVTLPVPFIFNAQIKKGTTGSKT